MYAHTSGLGPESVGFGLQTFFVVAGFYQVTRSGSVDFGVMEQLGCLAYRGPHTGLKFCEGSSHDDPTTPFVFQFVPLGEEWRDDLICPVMTQF
jgi:hypothetical protein